MKKLAYAIGKKIVAFFNNRFENIADAIEAGDTKRTVLNIVVTLLVFLLGVLTVFVLIMLVVKYQDIFWTWVGLPVTVMLIFAYLLSGKKDEKAETIDYVELEMVRQRARELYDVVRSLIFNAILGAATSTVLSRAYDEYEIQTSDPKDDHFYLDGLIPIYQFEAQLENSIDKAQEDIIQRELQRYVMKHVPRYPMLISEEAKGYAPVEILDVKNLGGRVLIDVVLRSNDTAASLIQSRRRARIMRQQRSADIYDHDF